MRAACALILGALAAAACGDDGSASTSGDGGGTSATSGGGGDATTATTGTVASSSSDASSSSAGDGGAGAGGSGAGGEPPEVGFRGQIRVWVSRHQNFSPLTQVHARFGPAEAVCASLAHEGVCTLYRCLENPPPSLDAGTVTFAGGELGTELQFPDYFQGFEAELVTAGDVVSAESLGTEAVPGFTLEATFPDRVAVTEPTFTEGLIDRFQGFPVAWSGGTTGMVSVLVTGTRPDRRTIEYQEIECSAPMRDEGLVVPASLLGPLVTATGVFVSVTERATGTLEVEDWIHTLTLSRFADAEQGPSGDAYGYFELE